MSHIHIVQPGDYLISIAEQYRISDWKKIYDHPDNDEFRKKRKNPNVIFPGDSIVIPDWEEGLCEGSTEKKHRFRKTSCEQVLRVKLRNTDGNPISDTSFVLVINGLPYEGITDGDGLVESRIPVDAQMGILRVGGHTWDLSIGHLNPLRPECADNGISGAQGRLLNLGYDVGDIDGKHGPKTEAALKQFQTHYSIEVTGQLDDTSREELEQAYGC